MRIGIYNPYLDTHGGGEKVQLALASVLVNAGHEVELITHKLIDVNEAAKYFGINSNGMKVTVVKLNPVLRAINSIPLLGGVKNLLNDMSTFVSIKRQKYDLFINNCYQSNLPSPAKKSIYMCMFPQKINNKEPASLIKKLYWTILRAFYRLLLHPSKKHSVYTYSEVVANSAYTQKYVKKYWDIESKILYPICDDMSGGKKTTKQKIILNVGRFFEKTKNSHHKRQDFLIESFIKLKSLQDDGWELHLAGSVAENVGGLKYILELIKMSSGHPIVFHFNSSFPNIKKLYNESSIYWHATGYGVDPDKFPEKQEHFGISTVEAMSVGAIPIVINTAGQKESVINGKNGFLWDTQKELLDYTKKIVTMNEDNKNEMLKNANLTAKSFGDSSFRNSVLEIINDFS